MDEAQNILLESQFNRPIKAQSSEHGSRSHARARLLQERIYALALGSARQYDFQRLAA